MQKAVAEAIGTFALVFAGTGAIVVALAVVACRCSRGAECCMARAAA